MIVRFRIISFLRPPNCVNIRQWQWLAHGHAHLNEARILGLIPGIWTLSWHPTKNACIPYKQRTTGGLNGRDGAYAGFCTAVGYPNRGGDHLSRSAVAGTLKRSTRLHRANNPVVCLTLLRVGFTKPFQSPGMLVVSYTTVSPLPA